MRLPLGYSEVLPPASGCLAIEAAWRFIADEACEHRVLPDGRCDIILYFRMDGRKPMGVITVGIAGAATRFHIVPIAAGTGYVGVRLRPGCARRVLDVDLGSITDRVLVGNEAFARVPALAELAVPASSIDQISDRLAAFVARRFGSLAIDPLTTGLIDTMHVTGGRLPIKQVASLHGVDTRTARRRIAHATGLSPKQMSMVIQFHRAMRLRFDDGLDAASAAFEAGYADQAHMSRAFRLMGGVSPARLPDLVLAGLPV